MTLTPGQIKTLTMTYKRAKLSALEQFVWNNREQNVHSLAGQTNRTENAIHAAYARAERKVRNNQAIDEIEARRPNLIANSLGIAFKA